MMDCKGLVILLISVTAVLGQRTRQQFFRTRPQDSFVSEGGRAIISCVIGNLGGRVQWTKDGLTLGYNRELPGFKRYSVVGSDESGIFNLQILNASLHDEAEYECQVGPNGTNKAIRESARLQVLLAPTSVEFEGYTSGSQLVVQESTEVELTCRAKDAKPKPDIVWYIGGVEITKGRREDEDEKGTSDKRMTVASTLRFRPTAMDNMKTISCEAQHPALTAGPMTASLQIFVQYPPGQPEISGYTPGEPIKRGSRVSLTCRSKGGNPAATLTWYKDGERIDSSYTNIKDGSTNTYEFIAQASDNNAEYSCQAKNDLVKKPLQAAIKMLVQYGPESVEILGPTEANLGEMLSFECVTSESNPPVDIWWVVDGRAVQGNHTRTLSSETGGWITRTNMTVSIGARDTVKNIQCQAINQAVKETKVQTHTVGVLYPFERPRIVGYSEEDTLVGGQQEKIKCTAQGGYPLASLKWFHRNTEVFSEYSVGENHASAILYLTPNMTDNGAVYRCVATSRAAPEPTEVSVRLAVKYAPTAVKIRTSPERLRQGTEATLVCESGEANPPATVVWIHDGVPLTGTTEVDLGSYGGRVTRNVLKFRVKTEDDGSVFTCKAQNEVGEALDAVTMSIAYAPRFPEVANPVEVVEGKEFVLNLTANGNPGQMTYRWTGPNGVVLGGQGLAAVNGGLLNISRATRDMAGTYTVTVNNSEGAADVKFLLDVLYAPRISSLTEYVMLEVGETAVFDCFFHSNPVKYDGIFWKKQTEDEEGLVDVYGTDPGVSVEWESVDGNGVNARLVMRNVTESDVGRYFCAVSNGIGGETLRETFLLVKSKPKMVIRQSSKSAAGNRETAILVCRAQGAPNITFTWRRMSGELGGGSKYEVFNRRVNPLEWESAFHVMDINPADYGIYECTARNALGLSKTQIILQQPSAPEIPRNFHTVNVTADSVILSWIPGFNGGSEQIYRVQYFQQHAGSLYNQPSYYDVYPMNSTSVLIAGLSSSSRYAFSIQALNDLGESAYTPDIEVHTLAAADTGSSSSSSSNNQPLVDGLTDTTSQNVPIIISISVGVCGTLLLLLSVILISCLVHRRNREKRSSATSATTTRSLSSSDSSTKSAAQDGLFNGSQGTSCYNDTMSEETMSEISEKSGSFISPHDGRISGLPHLLPEGYRPHAVSTYLTEQIGGIYSVEQGREIGFTSSNLPLGKNQFTTEDTESQYADELRRQAYIQTLGDGYNISQIGSSISYPNSPVGEYFTNSDMIESELQSTDINHPDNQPQHICHNNFVSGAQTLGRASNRFGSRKSPFQVVIPSTAAIVGGGGAAGNLSTPPVCSTPQNNFNARFPILAGLASPNRNLGEFSTFGGNGCGQATTAGKSREDGGHEPSGHLV